MNNRNGARRGGGQLLFRSKNIQLIVRRGRVHPPQRTKCIILRVPSFEIASRCPTSLKLRGVFALMSSKEGPPTLGRVSAGEGETMSASSILTRSVLSHPKVPRSPSVVQRTCHMSRGNKASRHQLPRSKEHRFLSPPKGGYTRQCVQKHRFTIVPSSLLSSY